MLDKSDRTLDFIAVPFNNPVSHIFGISLLLSTTKIIKYKLYEKKFSTPFNSTSGQSCRLQKRSGSRRALDK